MAPKPVMQIKLKKGEVQPESRTISCPDHLVLANLPVGRSLAGPSGPPAALVVKNVGRKASRSLGDRVHFCLKCDFPIAVYGRLSPCSHVFCLDCAKSKSSCYVCENPIEKIQSIKRGEPLFVCAADLCLKSFTEKVAFELHVEEVHGQSLKDKKEEGKGNESAASASTTVRVPPVLPKLPAAFPSVVAVRVVPPVLPKLPAAFSSVEAVRVVPPVLPKLPPAYASPIPVVQIHDREDTFRRPLMRDDTYYVPVPMRPPPFSEPIPIFNNLSATAMAPPPNVQQAFHGAPFDMGRLSLGPSVMGLPPNAFNMGHMPPPRGAPPTTNAPGSRPNPRQHSMSPPSPRRRPHLSRPHNN